MRKLRGNGFRERAIPLYEATLAGSEAGAGTWPPHNQDHPLEPRHGAIDLKPPPCGRYRTADGGIQHPLIGTRGRLRVGVRTIWLSAAGGRPK
ncbi:hypothetical protein [Amycolatopsis azurea]|uniref:hypothetical protein n=1 Tax=Amycolatopsis azurea TaxID=36819 RepID=UPI0011779115|nr:hypothetical protein [Amycolatopsis azurea]